MNRRGTEPYARWCERTGDRKAPSYSIIVRLSALNPLLDIVKLSTVMSVNAQRGGAPAANATQKKSPGDPGLFCNFRKTGK